ncbi:MAG: hypothetical protein ACE5R6_00750 [Candidatus Heimdallarchaeota archaeon]
MARRRRHTRGDESSTQDLNRCEQNNLRRWGNGTRAKKGYKSAKGLRNPCGQDVGDAWIAQCKSDCQR